MIIDDDLPDDQLDQLIYILAPEQVNLIRGEPSPAMRVNINYLLDMACGLHFGFENRDGIIKHSKTPLTYEYIQYQATCN